MASVRSLTQSVTDVIADSRFRQRDIGTLINNKNSLIVKGTLTNVNKVDFFKFTVKSDLTNIGVVTKATGREARPGGAKQTISSVDVKNDVGYARVQILNSRGAVIADSSSTASLDVQKTYQLARGNKLKLDAGSYTIKVSRSPGVVSSQKVVYGVQLLAGKQTAEYTTKQLDATEADATAKLVTGQTALDILDASEETDLFSPVSTGSLFDYYT